MQLFLVRHAESENNARPNYLRVEDPAITPVGRLQADALARWAKSLKIDVLITSPFRRTLQTANIVGQVAELPQALVWHDVFERGGCYCGYEDQGIEGRPGLGRSSILVELPTAVLDDSISEEGWWFGRAQETEQETLCRATAVIARIIEMFSGSGQNIFAILHADFIRTMLIQMLDGSADATHFGPLRNTGITKVDYDGARWRLDWLNSVTHLPARLITGVEW